MSVAMLAASMMGVCAAAPDGQELRLVRPDAFTETYLDQPPQGPSRGAVVGAVVVGIRLDGPDGQFNPANLRVRIGSAPPATNAKLCVRMISRDGRYFAKGQYEPSSSAGSTPALGFRSNYGKLLSSYSQRDMASVAFLSDNCDGVSGEFVATQFSPGAAPNHLVVQVRAGDSRVRAQLLQGREPIGAAALCAPFEGSTVGYTGECALALPADLTSGAYTLAVGETSASGDIKVRTYPVRLWMDR